MRREEGARLFTVERRVNLPSRTTGRQQIEIQLATGRNSRMRRDETYEALPICLASGSAAAIRLALNKLYRVVNSAKSFLRAGEGNAPSFAFDPPPTGVCYLLTYLL